MIDKGLIGRLVSKIRTKIQPGYKSPYYKNPEGYWDRRHEEAGTSLEGVGLSGLGSEGNLRDYEKKWESISPILERLRSEGCHQLLDAGCGIGWFSDRALELGFEVEGVDFSASAIETARTVSPEVRWHVAELTDFCPGREYDLVMAIDVLFHIVDDEIWQRSVLNLGELTKAGGYLLVQEELSAQEDEVDDPTTRHVRRRSERLYQGVMSGWDLIEHTTYLLPAQQTGKDLLLFRRSQPGDDGDYE